MECQHKPDKVSLKEDVNVKTGNNSMETEGTVDIPFYDLKVDQKSVPDFVRHATRFLHSDMFHIDAAGVHISSRISQVVDLRGLKAPVTIDSVILPYVPASIPNAQIHPLEIQSLGADRKDTFTDAQLAVFSKDGFPNYKFIKSRVRNSLPGINKNVVRASLDAIGVPFIYDNSMMYAKMLHYVLLIDGFAEIPGNVAPVPIAFDDEELHWINYTALDFAEMTSSDILSSLRITLVHNEDYFDGDELAIRYLVSPGRRLDRAPDAPAPHAAYISWPTISVNILSTTDQPAPPALAVPSSTSLLLFIERLASTRCEWDDFLKGLYIALELAGTRMIDCGKEDLGWRPIRSSFLMSGPCLPNVVDYNLLFRLCGVFPAKSIPYNDPNSDIRMEIQPFTSGPSGTPNCRVLLAALYNAVYSAGVTTFLHSLNISAGDMLIWQSAVDVPHSCNNLLIGKMLTALYFNFDPVINNEIALISQPRAMFSFLGWQAHTNLFPHDGWFDGCSQMHAPAIFAQFPNAFAPRFINQLSIHNLLLKTPREWAIHGPGPKVDLARGVRDVGPPALRGWYAYQGESKYSTAAAAEKPMQLVTYGAQAINYLCGHYEWNADNIPNVHMMHTECQHLTIVGPLAYPIPSDLYVGPLHTFQPCVFRSYDYVNKVVMSPVLLDDALNAAKRRHLNNYRGIVLRSVGYCLARNPSHLMGPFVDLEDEIDAMNALLSPMAKTSLNS